MIIKNKEVTILKIAKKEGVGKKSGKEYKFYVCVFVDDEGIVQNATVANDLVTSSGEDTLTSVIVQKADIDFKISSSGFSTRLEIVEIKL